MPKYRVLENPYCNAGPETIYDIQHRAGDIIEVDALPKEDRDGDVLLPVRDGTDGWISLDCLAAVPEFAKGDIVRFDTNGSFFVYSGSGRQFTNLSGRETFFDLTLVTKILPDGLTVIEGDEVIGRLVFGPDASGQVVRGRVTMMGNSYPLVTVLEGPASVQGDVGRAIKDTYLIKAGTETEGDIELAEWERQLLENRQFGLSLTEEELKSIVVGPLRNTVVEKAQALLPKPKMVTVELTESTARHFASAFRDSRVGPEGSELRNALALELNKL